MISVDRVRRLGHRCGWSDTCPAGARFTVKGAVTSDYDPVRHTAFVCPRHVSAEVQLRVDAWLYSIQDPQRASLDALPTKDVNTEEAP